MVFKIRIAARKDVAPLRLGTRSTNEDPGTEGPQRRFQKCRGRMGASILFLIFGKSVVVLVLSRARISVNFANSSENIMRNRVPPLQNFKKGYQKIAAKPPFGCAVSASIGGGKLDF